MGMQKKKTDAAKPQPAEARPATPDTENVDEVEDGDAEDAEPKAKKHNTGAADLDKVTDFFEEQEMSVSGKNLEDIFKHEAEKQRQEQHDRAQKDAALAQVQVAAEDIELLMNEFEIEKKVADRTLREHNGDVTAALRALVALS